MLEELQREVSKLQRKKPGKIKATGITVQQFARSDDCPWEGNWYSCAKCYHIFANGDDQDTQCPECGHQLK
jgi:rubrerythrin